MSWYPCCCRQPGSSVAAFQCGFCQPGTLPSTFLVEIEGMPETPCFNRLTDCIDINGAYVIEITQQTSPGGGITYCWGDLQFFTACGGSPIGVRVTLRIQSDGRIFVLAVSSSGTNPTPQWPDSPGFPPGGDLFGVYHFTGWGVQLPLDGLLDCSLISGTVIENQSGTSPGGKLGVAFCSSPNSTVTLTAIQSGGLS